jgi:hypothetical protein
MRLHTTTGFLAITALSICLAIPASDAHAKGKGSGKAGRGGGKATAGVGGTKGGRGAVRPHNELSTRGRRSTTDHQSDRTLHRDQTRSHRGLDRGNWSTRDGHRWTTTSDDASSHPWSMQRANEEGKLNHRLGVADKLDQLADRTGNPNLRDTAERMRAKAHEHYEKRLSKINSKDPSYVPPEEGGVAHGDDHVHSGGDDALSDSPDHTSHTADEAEALDDLDNAVDAVERLTGRENALYRQLRNEQRKLAHRMEAAERLWEAYEQTGDEALADAARVMEERTLAHFDKRIQAISDFQQRHGLSDQVGEMLHEMENFVAEVEETSDLLNLAP